VNGKDRMEDGRGKREDGSKDKMEVTASTPSMKG